MLYAKVRNGILFISFEGDINDNTVADLNKEIDYMLYTQGINYYAFNFKGIDELNNKFLSLFQNKLVEIFLRCGSVVLYGINNIYKKIIGNRRDNLFYVEDQKEICNLLNL